MKKILYLSVLVLVLLMVTVSLSGCENLKKDIKHIKSNAVGLNRIVEQRDFEGNVIKQYEGKFKVEIIGDNAVAFILDNGREVKLFGGIIAIEEK